MRTTLSIDDDVLAAARERARREGSSVGAVISDLARAALTGGAADSGGPQDSFLGFEPLPPRGGLVTNALIDELLNEEG